jgi:hypothetical protein
MHLQVVERVSDVDEEDLHRLRRQVTGLAELLDVVEVRQADIPD